MIKKEQCVPGTIVKVNKKHTKWNSSVQLGVTNPEVLFAFPHNSYELGDTSLGILPGNNLEILSKPKRSEAGTIVTFKILSTGAIASTWWICIMHKVDIVKSNMNLKIED